MTFKFPAVDITDRADGKVPAWDDGDQIHKYVTPASVASAVGCVVSGNSTALTVNDSVALAFNVADIYDPDGFHDPSSANTRITVPAGLGGIYLLTTYCSWPSSGSANTDRRILYTVDGSGGLILFRDRTSVTSSSVFQTASVAISLSAGSYVEVLQFTGIGSTTTTSYQASLFRLAAV